MIDPNCRLCFGRGWVLYPRLGGGASPEACHYCARLESPDAGNAVTKAARQDENVNPLNLSPAGLQRE